jgi:hypothetical protein
MTRLGSLFRHLLARRRPLDRRPRLIRRVTIHCPHSGRPVEVDLLLGKTGWPELVLRCSAHSSCPPTCDQACRQCAESVLAPARALIICPPGTGPPVEID